MSISAEDLGLQPASQASVSYIAPWRSDTGKIIAPRLATWLQAETPTAIGGSNVYAYIEGVYRLAEDDLARRIHDLAGDDWKRHLAAEVIGSIRASSPLLDDTPPLDRINVTNGIYNLKTGRLQPHTPDLRSPVQLPVKYDPGARCPRIEQYLTDTLDPDVARLFLEIAGVLLTPDNRHQRAFLFKGPKGNGKTTAINLLTKLIGPANVSHVALQQLDEHRFAAAQLYGKLANFHSDLPSRAVNGTSTFKQVTGGDPIMAEHKGRDPFTFQAYARFVFSANETPPTHDGSEAYFDRWTILPFTRTFRGAKHQDRDLLHKLTTPNELSGLLNLALATIPDVRTHGFTIGTAVRDELHRFRLDSDPVAAFLDEHVALKTDARTSRSALYKAYTAWCKDTGRSALAAHRFYARVLERFDGAVAIKTVKGDRQFAGLHLDRSTT